VRRYAFPFALLVMVLLGAHAIHLPSAVGSHEGTQPAIRHSLPTERTMATHWGIGSAGTESPASVSHTAGHAIWCAIQAVTPKAQVAFVLALTGSLLPLLALRQASSGPLASAPAWRAPPQQQRALLQVFLF
jgi:hypothetical protein